VTRGVSSLEVDEDGSSGGSQRYMAHKGRRQHDDFHSPNLAILGEDVGKQDVPRS